MNLHVAPQWSTACVDWEQRILDRRSLVPFEPLFADEAAKALAIFRQLRIVDVPASPTFGEVSLPWAFDLPRALFGSYDAASGRRQIQFFFELIAKKNTKSTRAAAIMVTALIRNWRRSAEFMILAPTREVADNSFIPARDMIRANSALNAILHIREDKRTIEHRETRATLKVLAADTETVGGKKTVGLLVDELWMLGKRANAEAMLREAVGGLVSRPEGFVIFLSTQSDGPPEGVFAQKLDEFRAIRDGKIKDPRSLPLLYEFPDEMLRSGAYREPKNWHVVNPNIGASVDEEFLIGERTKAARAGRSSLINFEAKHLNVQVGALQRSDGWAGALIWNRGADNALTLDELLRRSEVVAVGIDGGGLDDLVGVGVLGRERGTTNWLAWAHGYISTIGAYRRKANAESYLRFKRAGDLTVFRFGHPDEDFIEDDPALAPLLEGVQPAKAGELPPDIAAIVGLVKRIRDMGLLAQVGVDAAGIGAIVDALAQINITQDAETLDAVRQGIALMGAIKTLERKLSDGTLRHGDQPILGWCAGNLKVIQTPTGMRVARDEAGFGKIDPIMGLFNAAHLLSLNPDVIRKPTFQAFLVR